METQQLLYFQTAAMTENMTQAASMLHISQPALSKSIRQLEEELHQPLFERCGRNIRLNEYGRIFLNYVNASFRVLENGKKELDSFRKSQESTITLLVNTALTSLPHLAAGFLKQHPDVILNLWQSHNIQEDTTYDFSLDVQQLPVEDQNHLTMLNEKIQLAVPINHPLAKRESVAMAELAGEVFLSLPGNTTFRKIIDAYCMQNGLNHRVVCECFNYRNTKELVKLGAGIAFFPELTWGFSPDPDPDLVLLPVTPVCKRYLILSWPENKIFSQVQLEFRSYLLQFFESLSHRQIFF